MLAQNQAVYIISGWGFSAKLLFGAMPAFVRPVALDYHFMAAAHIAEISEMLAPKIPDHATLLGWSLGGLVAIDLASRFPKKAHKLILIATQPQLVAKKDWQGICQKDAARFMQGFCDKPRQQMLHFIQLVNYPNRQRDKKRRLLAHFVSLPQYQTPLSAQLHVLFGTDLKNAYQNLNLKVLHMVHGQDAVLGQNADQLRRLNPGVSLVNLPHLGHAGFLHDSCIYQKHMAAFLL